MLARGRWTRGEKEGLRSSATVFDAREVKRSGAKEVARQAAKVLNGSSDWIIVHLDVDVLDPSTVPEVNFPESHGLTCSEVLEIFGELRSTGKLWVVDLRAYSRIKDEDGMGRSFLLDLAPTLATPWSRTGDFA